MTAQLDKDMDMDTYGQGNDMSKGVIIHAVS